MNVKPRSKRRKATSRTERDIRTASSTEGAGLGALYKAYAVAADGSREPMEATSIVVDTGVGEVKVGLEVLYPILRGRLRVGVGDGLLVVGPGDASSIYVCAKPWKRSKRRRA
jgi:hypothetical protein